ncbi:cold-shock protein [Streptomyces sp. NPDC057910]|uniref:cold-shock protein n=1 Tax=Streptomyces sp. NPDC057910 TaxID=3346278 RepID=UPI0036E84C33
MPTGVVLEFNRYTGAGWIGQDDGGPDLYLHYPEIHTADGDRALFKGEAVNYEVAEDGPYGPAAANVSPVDPMRSIPNAMGHGGDREFGEVMWFNPEKGFGYIMATNGGSDVYVTDRALNGIHSLNEGDVVVYETETGPDGRGWAANVSLAQAEDDV